MLLAFLVAIVVAFLSPSSLQLTKHADIVFAPYNYVLDPGIRKAMGIDVSNAIVVLDEAHNVEDVLMESGSVDIDEFEVSKRKTFFSGACRRANPLRSSPSSSAT